MNAVRRGIAEKKVVGRAGSPALNHDRSPPPRPAPLGLIIAGPVADKYGAQSWFLVGGVLTLLMGLGSIFIPAITHLEDGRAAAQPTEAEKAALAPVTGD